MNEELRELLLATTVSSVGVDITIMCHDHDTKDRILDFLMSASDAGYKHELDEQS